MNDAPGSVQRHRFAKGTSFTAYRSIIQIRSEGWSRLKRNVTLLASEAEQGRESGRQLQMVHDDLALLEALDSYWAFPSRQDYEYLHELFSEGDYDRLREIVIRISRALASHSYRHRPIHLRADEETDENDDDEYSDAHHERRRHSAYRNRPYFELLVVDNISPREEEALKDSLRRLRRSDDRFVYEVVVVPSFEDALIAALFNFNIQAVVIRYGFPFESVHEFDLLRHLVPDIESVSGEDSRGEGIGPRLGACIAELRPELDLYLVTDVAVERIAGDMSRHFRRIFYREEDYTELDLSILRGVGARYDTPFFTALKQYSRQPTGVFHALPVSRAKSIINSNWIQDMLDFYGPAIFMAETSATSGGLDSLLEPTGPIKRAQRLAARAFGARQTYFVTNGTSTGNKIVVQALVEPGDIVLVDRNCHKSHHYGMVITGARTCYLDSYPLETYTMYGAVPLRHIKETLLAYKRAGDLDRVKMLLLTNCTFDGVIYDPERVMEECLAIKPDLVFLWDEAWFAFAGFHPLYRRRTAMATAARMRDKYRSPQYRELYAAHRAETGSLDPDDDATWLERRLLPDPDKVRIRVYATHSTHKRLTALRQGSMIHVFDQDFKHKAEDAFREAFMCHTSTSPNYQILASLDVGRRQAALEGFELVQQQTELALALHEAVSSHPLLSKYFRFLSIADLIPEEYRSSGVRYYFDPKHGWEHAARAWKEDEFVLEPSHLSLYIGNTGIDGDTFKHEQLMDKFGIQVNKTTRNTVLFMTNIGTTRSSVAYLIEVLVKIAQELEEEAEDRSNAERRLHAKRVKSLSQDVPPLPNFSRFHPRFRGQAPESTRDGNVREPFFLSYQDQMCEYVELSAVRELMASGRDLVSATFVIPYPPGFPILVPGQVISKEIVAFMEKLDTREIHGYNAELGFRVFNEEVLQSQPAEAA